MAAPKGQVTFRLEDQDYKGFEEAKSLLGEIMSGIRVPDGEVHRRIYHEGLNRVLAQLREQRGPVPSPEAPTPEAPATSAPSAPAP